MKQIIPTTQYKKDLKRYANQRKKMESLLEILRCLANEEPIPENCRPHMPPVVFVLLLWKPLLCLPGCRNTLH